MRFLPVFFSIVLHVTLLAFGALYHPAPDLNVDLRKRSYTVDLVTLPTPAPPEKKPRSRPSDTPVKTAPAKTPPAVKSAPAQTRPAPPEPVQASQPKPQPKKIVKTAKKPPKDAPTKKISPKKRPEVKREKSVPAEPVRKAPPSPKSPPVKKPSSEPSSEEILARALGSARQKASDDEKNKARSAQDALAQELASLQKSVGSSSADGSGGAAGVVEEIFGAMVEEQVRGHWRFPRLGNLGLSAEVEIVVDPTGQVVSKRVIRPSGRADFDASVLRAVEEAGELPDPPERRRWTVRITFNLAEQG